MAASALTLPEAREQAREVGVLYHEAAQRYRHASRRVTDIDTQPRADEEYAARVIELADDLLYRLAHRIQSGPTEGREELQTMQTQTQAIREAAFLLIQQANPDDAWFWTPEWQAKEREADADLTAGRFMRFESDEDLLAFLHTLRSDVADP